MEDVAKQEYTKVKVEGILNLKKLSGEYELTPEELVGFIINTAVFRSC